MGLASLIAEALFAPAATRASAPSSVVAQEQAGQRPATRRTVRAGYDAAGDHPDFRRHWAHADALSPNAALTPSVRDRLRRRARYEVANNSYAKGIVDTLANDVIGIGPRLRVVPAADGDTAKRDAQAIERAFTAWARESMFADKLRLLRKARADSGEVFIVAVTNESLRGPVKLDLRLIEADQVATPFLAVPTAGEIDGIVYDDSGNPTAYSILRDHPGSGLPGAWRADPVAASKVIHYFRADRPGQGRGIPDITPALHLFAQMRRFTRATLDAAETAANIALFAQTDASPIVEEAPEAAASWDTFEIEPNTIMSLPAGYKIGQLDAKHPTTTYDMFMRALIREIGRCLSMPFNIAAADSASYNYSSGKLDHLTYDRSIEVDRFQLECSVLARIFEWWFEEAILVEDGIIPQSYRMADAERPSIAWIWTRRGSIDQQKDEGANALALANGTTNLQILCAQKGEDWEEVQRQRAIEIASARSLGIPVAGDPAPVDQSQPDQQEVPA